MEFFAELSVALLSPTTDDEMVVERATERSMERTVEGGEEQAHHRHEHGNEDGGGAEEGEAAMDAAEARAEATTKGSRTFYNKWYPHNRDQLKAHDPHTFAELRRIWRDSARACVDS